MVQRLVPLHSSLLQIQMQGGSLRGVDVTFADDSSPGASGGRRRLRHRGVVNSDGASRELQSNDGPVAHPPGLYQEYMFVDRAAQIVRGYADNATARGRGPLFLYRLDQQIDVGGLLAGQI